LKPTVYIKKHMFMAPKLHHKLTRYTFLHLSLLFASEVEMTERYTVLELLLQHGANVNARDRSGRTPLHWASGYADELPECMILLLEKGANLNAPDIKGRTPLQTAVRYNAEQAVELLLKRGADTEAVNWKGLKALEIAGRRGHRDCEKLLLQ
jgi:ankyrin repeat protein